MNAVDENDRLRSGTLPSDPFADTQPYEPPPASTGRRQPRMKVVKGAGSSMPRFLRADHVELAAALIQELQHSGPIVFSEGSLYQYSETSGVFALLEQATESKVVQSFAGAHVAEKPKPLAIRHSDVSGAIKLAHDQVAEATFFAGAPNGLAFANGFVQFVDGDPVILTHSADRRARTSFPFDFDVHASRERFISFLGDLFRDDDDSDEKQLLLQQFCGACLLGIAPRYQIALVLLGDGANGKSSLIEVIRESMPMGTTSAIPPQSWDHEYRRALLVAKRLNIVSELPEMDILSSEAFKAIVTGDSIDARPIREAPFTFTPIAGHCFAANRLPGANDLTQGFWRRLLVLRFNRVFRGTDARPDIAREILTAERPGIVAWMIEGAKQLIQRRGYTVPASAVRERDDWRRQANPVALFLSECTRDVRDAETGTQCLQLYNSFRSWAERNGHRAMSSTKFGMRMREVEKGAVKGRHANSYPVIVIASGGES